MDECPQNGGWFHWLLLFLFSVWESWLGKTKRVIANSSWGILSSLLARVIVKNKKDKKMEKDIKVGDGNLEIKIDAGKASLSFDLKVDGAAMTVGAKVEVGADVLVDRLHAAIKAKYPAGAPIEDAVFSLIKAAVMSA